MNCTVCGKPHSKEQPLTVIEDMLPIGEVIAFCPGCLKEVEIVNIPPYGRSQAEVAEALVNCRCTMPPFDDAETGGALSKSKVVSYGAKLKVGDRVLPIEGFEMR